jgi:GDP-mannose 6-dehydrogenase
MNISIFGMGYVGVVTAACLAKKGHCVIGVDVAQEKIDLINTGKSPIIEADIEELVKEVVNSGKLQATHDAKQAVAGSDIAIVCVGTPSNDNGGLNTQYVEIVTKEIGEQLVGRERPFCFILRSTVLPGTVREKIIPILETYSGKKVGDGMDVLFHPEFLREGSSVRDFYFPPKIVIGELVCGSGSKLMELYNGIEAPRFQTTIEVAEILKYSDNVFHATKITFANEIGQICYENNVDSRQVMDIFCADTKLNISPVYLKPGFAFGGSCLPKDLRAMVSTARKNSVAIPMLEHVLESNKQQIERVLNLIIKNRPRKIGFFGIAFKAGTDDLRESPYVELAERLFGKGYYISIFDQFVQINRLIGKNKAYIDQILPHIANLLVTTIEEMENCDTILVNHRIESDQVKAWLKSGKMVFDLTGCNTFNQEKNYIPII